MKVGTVYWMLSSSCQDVWSLCTYVAHIATIPVNQVDSVERLFSDEVVVHLLATIEVNQDSVERL